MASLPVGLASVDCNGTESSLLDCTSSQNDRQACGIEGTNLTDATVLTCANTADSAFTLELVLDRFICTELESSNHKSVERVL